jgi:diguanylate cyclase (GGDEF)-like protein
MSAAVVLLAVTALANLLMVAVLGSLARSGIAGIRECIRGAVLVFVALLMFAGQEVLHPVLSILGGHLLMAIGTAYYLAAVARFFDRPVPLGWLSLAVGADILAIVLFWRVWPDTDMRIAAVSVLQALFTGATAVIIHRYRPRDREAYPYLFALFVAGFESAGHAVRALVYAMRWESMPSLAQATPANVVFLSIGVLAVPSLILGMIVMVHDRMLAERESEANIDSLTGVLARKAWWRLADRTVARATRADQRLSLLMVDIDRFKDVNDTHGHAVGDAVLQHFGTLAASVLRQEDILGRLGGEEFAVLFPDTRIDAAAFATNRLLDAVRKTTCSTGQRAISYTFSGGLVEWDGEESAEALAQRADRALYAAKQAGRDRVAVQY